MKAVTYSHYGSPDVLRFEEMEKPIPADKEVLLKVFAASVNPLDWHFIRGTPYFVRLMAGLYAPKETRLGVDVAGQVESVGRDVTQFKPGDAVFGSCRGAFAEYVCAAESALVSKPESLTFEQAAAVPVAGFTALQGLRDKGQIRAGQKVLINGAAGGVGTFAVQIAKALGADVTGVCSTRNLELVRSLGADQAMDYTREDFTRNRQRYDLIFECVGNHSFLACQRVLTPNGICVGCGGGGPEIKWMIAPLVGMIAAQLFSCFVSQKSVGFIAKPNKEDLTCLCAMIETGKITPVIDRSYKLSETSAAIRYLEAGHARGKVVLIVE